MKLVRITMELLVENDTRADKWVFSAIDNELESGEVITNFDYVVLQDNYEEDLS